MNSFLLYKNGKILDYATSMASTWIWAPAIFVSGFMGYRYGILGLAVFTIPNFLALMLFGYVANYIINKKHISGYTFFDVIKKKSIKQSYLHVFLGIILLICSILVQMLGLHTLLCTWFTPPKWLSALLISIIAIAVVWRGGIKTSIITDSWKYFITLGVGLILLVWTLLTNSENTFQNIKIYDFNDFNYLIGFGITTTLGLLSAPYIDQTFWQRAFSVPKDRLESMFNLSALFFLLIPFSFGLTGLLIASNSTSISDTWQITQAFTGLLGILLGIGIFATLLSTIDSDLCAVQSIAKTVFRINPNTAMIFILLVCGIVFCLINITIPDLFLIYGTMRTALAVPTLLIVFERFSITRLYVATILAIIIGAGGYLIATICHYQYTFIFTILAFIIPFLGYSKLSLKGT